MGPTHGQEAQEDPDRLRRLSCSHPWRATNRDTHAVVTGEPDARKASPSGSGGGRRVGSSATPPDGLPRWSGPTRTAASEWRPRATGPDGKGPRLIDPARLGKAIPYGVYDLAANTGWVNVGADARHRRVRRRVDPPLVAAPSAATAYPDATRLLITADGGGSNGYRARLWKTELAALAAETGLTDHRLPPATRAPRNGVAVGTALAGGPPHRSQRAGLPHWAPASGSGSEAHGREGMPHAGWWEPPVRQYGSSVPR